MRRISVLLFLLTSWLTSHSQPCVLHAYEGFDHTEGIALNGLAGGSGFDSPWMVQNDDVGLPGYQTGSLAQPLVYADLQGIGGHARGGRVWLTAGRRLSSGPEGPFSRYVETFGFGIGSKQEGDTLWVSALLRKDQNNNQEVYADLHDSPTAWCNNCADIRVGMGYFGTGSEVGGQRRWSLRVGSFILPTESDVVTGQTALMVLRLVFAPGSTEIGLFVDPPFLAGDDPEIPDLTFTSSEPVVFQSIAVYLGNSPDNGSVDEIRMAGTYRCATPDSQTPVDLPPVAMIQATPESGNAPLVVMFDGTASWDPDGLPLAYSWNFGDGTPVSDMASIDHIYDGFAGQITAILTVRDASGQTHSASRLITVLNAENTFSCQTTVNCLSMADCSGTGGYLEIGAGPDMQVTLLGPGGQEIPPGPGDDYSGLAAGSYLALTAGMNGCRDTMALTIRIDSTTCTGWVPDSCAMALGTNLSGFADWVPERPLRNLLKHVRPGLIPYTPNCFCWEIQGLLSEMSFDGDGYPTHIPQTTSQGEAVVRFFLSSEGANLPPGQDYVVLYDGQGELVMSGEAAVISSAPGRIVFTSTGGGNIWMNLLASEAGNPVRRIRIVRLADEGIDVGNDLFYPGFLEKIAPFRTLRFMDWGHTNNNPVVHWEDRTRMTHFTYAHPEGVPYELMIRLANQTGKDVWVCVPHAADDDYVTRMAELFRDSLDPGLTVYVEYSNEVWNWIFDQAHFNDQNRPSHLNYGRAMAHKAGRVFRIWHDVFGAEKHRVKRVLGIQAGFNWLNEQILAQLPAGDWDLGSPTHYIGLDHGSGGQPVLHAGSSAEDILENAWNTFLGFKESVKQDYRNIQVYGKEVVTYEGGQHFVGNVFGIPYDYQQAMWDAQFHPGIYDLYLALHDSIRSWGCRLATNFSLASRQESVYGSWGVLDDIDVAPPYMATAPKYQALLDLICEGSPVALEGPQEGTRMLHVWPNPGQGLFRLAHPYPGQPSRMALYDLTGSAVWRNETAGPEIQLDVPDGMYFLEVMVAGMRYVACVVVTRG